MDYLYYSKQIIRAIFELYELYRDNEEVIQLRRDIMEHTKDTVDLFMYERQEYSFVEQMVVMRVKQLTRVIDDW